MASKVEESQYEVEDLLRVFGPRLQGLRELATMKVSADSEDMSPRAHQDILDSIENYERRLMLMNAQHDADVALLADGYPNIAEMAIDPVSLASIRSNAASVALAAGLFVAETPPPAEPMAGALNPAAGAVELKPTA